MDLIERYLANVRVLLPKSQRDDIIAELRDVLRGSREEEAAKLGHSLSEAEEESLLREFGHPILVAGRYRPQQYLIGPDLYPVYSFVLKLVLAIIAAAALLVGIVGTVASVGTPGGALRLALSIAWGGFFNALGYITLIFAGLQRYSKPLRLLTDWRARDLPVGKQFSRVRLGSSTTSPESLRMCCSSWCGSAWCRSYLLQRPGRSCIWRLRRSGTLSTYPFWRQLCAQLPCMRSD